MATSSKAASFTIEIHESDLVRVSDGKVAFVRFRSTWKWEFYVIQQAGRSRGLEMFHRHLTDAEAARIDESVATEQARRNLASKGRSAELTLILRDWSVSPTGRILPHVPPATGRYDVACYECRGERVVPEVNEDHLTTEQQAAIEARAERMMGA